MGIKEFIFTDNSQTAILGILIFIAIIMVMIAILILVLGTVYIVSSNKRRTETARAVEDIRESLGALAKAVASDGKYKHDKPISIVANQIIKKASTDIEPVEEKQSDCEIEEVLDGAVEGKEKVREMSLCKEAKDNLEELRANPDKASPENLEMRGHIFSKEEISKIIKE